jgi:hypothetical protein
VCPEASTLQREVGWTSNKDKASDQDGIFVLVMPTSYVDVEAVNETVMNYPAPVLGVIQ